MPSKFEKFLPYAGVLAGILFAVNGYVAQVSEKSGDPEALQIMKDHMLENFIAAGAAPVGTRGVPHPRPRVI